MEWVDKSTFAGSSSSRCLDCGPADADIEGVASLPGRRQLFVDDNCNCRLELVNVNGGLARPAKHSASRIAKRENLSSPYIQSRDY